MQDPRHEPTPRLTHKGLESKGNTFSFQSREKNVLDFSSYRSGDSTSVRFSFAFLRVNECNGDITSNYRDVFRPIVYNCCHVAQAPRPQPSTKPRSGISFRSYNRFTDYCAVGVT